MRETVLIYEMAEDRLKKLKFILLKQKLRGKVVLRQEYHQPSGYLAGIKEILPLEEGNESERLPGEMLLFAGLSDQRLHLLLSAMRKEGVRVDCKAVLTPENSYWNAHKLYHELYEEHQLMHGSSSTGQ
ncbi:MAG: DUF3783 domain-containing protein [Clostridiales bacterium]|nr:DUF3783 domain-containing protein [Clostridiales bacterium]